MAWASVRLSLCWSVWVNIVPSKLYVISGPSGAGKGTLVALLMDLVPEAWLSISATTRQPRKGEIDGVHYLFLTTEQFEQDIENDGFLEWARYNNNYYGTPLAPIRQHLDKGQPVILEIEVQGAFQVREKFPEACLIFIEPPSLEELERRLVNRGTESPEVIRGRMETAKREMALKMEYDIRLVNDNLEQATEELVSIVRGCK